VAETNLLLVPNSGQRVLSIWTFEERTLGPLEMGVNVFSHVVSVVIRQGLAADSTHEYTVFIPLHHGLDKTIET